MIELSVYSEAALGQMHAQQVQDSIEYFEPDAVYLPSNRYRFEFQEVLPAGVTVVTDREGQRLSEVTSCEETELVVAPRVDALDELAERDRNRGETSTTWTYVLSDLLEVETDLTALETRLTGQEAYEDALQPAAIDSEYMQLLTTADPGYRATWGELELQGVMPGASQHGGSAAEVAHLTLHPDGIVTVTRRDASAFGLQALDQVGASRAETLRDYGFKTPQEVTSVPFHEIQELPDFGRKTAETVRDAATAFVEGEVQRCGSESMPNTEPVFIDIETDGLHPTMVWLIGVLDRAGEESYLSFLATDPDDPGEAVEAFMAWYRTNASDRPLVAYNGFNFDFPVLEEHIQQFCPQYLDDWQEAWMFDPYRWAVHQENAVLPGRTNKLEDVAAKLGWEGADTGLSGGVVARLFQRYMANPSAETELDWGRHKRYCENDVRALAHVFDAIADAPRRVEGTEADGRSESSQTENTAQGRLSDF